MLDGRGVPPTPMDVEAHLEAKRLQDTAGAAPKVCEETRDPAATSMELQSGVHLIEEMEKQVAQWEESESVRAVAYQAWVYQRMQQQDRLKWKPGLHGMQRLLLETNQRQEPRKLHLWQLGKQKL